MIINEETKMALRILVALPTLIIVLNYIKLMHLEDQANKKQLSFKQRDWILNRNRRCKKK